MSSAANEAILRPSERGESFMHTGLSSITQSIIDHADRTTDVACAN